MSDSHTKPLPFGTLTTYAYSFDLYTSIGTTLSCGVKVAAAYHYFYDDGFDAALGQEIDLSQAKTSGAVSPSSGKRPASSDRALSPTQRGFRWS